MLRFRMVSNCLAWQVYLPNLGYLIIFRELCITPEATPGQLETQCSIWTGWPDGCSMLAGWSFPIAVSGWGAHLDFQSIWPESDKI